MKTKFSDDPVVIVATPEIFEEPAYAETSPPNGENMPDSFTITLNYWQIGAVISACLGGQRILESADYRRIAIAIQEQRKAQWKDAPEPFKAS